MAPHAAKSSTAIRSKTNRKALAAQEHAYRLGHALNRFVTVHWEWTRFANRDRRAAVKALREMERHWMIDRGLPFYDICVRENPPQIGSRPSNGEHLHQALYQPPERWAEFEAKLNKWLGATDPQALVIKPVNDRNLVRWYFMKAGTDAVRRANGIPDTPRFSTMQGKIVGPRVIISYSLNRKAIDRALGIDLAKEVLAPKPIDQKRTPSRQRTGR